MDIIKQMDASQRSAKYVLYRITSRINHKPRIDSFSKLDFLDNLVDTFFDYKIICIADNCDEETINFLKTKGFYKLISTALGNAGSFNYLINHELSLLNDDDLVYFAEDDYRYRALANKVLEEGVHYFDYVTLYDHPDKYGIYPFNINPLVPSGKFSEHTQIIKGAICIWRTTNSTTMSFGCYVKTFRRDRYVWDLFTKISKVPRDFYIWLVLTCPTRNIFLCKPTIGIVLLIANILSIIKRPRKLGVPMPSASSHMEKQMLPDNYEKDFCSK
jgi:hypothetical protein